MPDARHIRSVSTDQLLRVGALFFVLVPGCAAVGHFFGGLLALTLEADEETWMRRGEIFGGCGGTVLFAGFAIAILT